MGGPPTPRRRSAVDTTLRVYTVSLNQDGSPLLKYIRLPPPDGNGYKLRFILPVGSDMGEHARLYTNCPQTEQTFVRNQFQALSFKGGIFDDRYCDVSIRQVGAFEYHVESDTANATAGTSASLDRQRGEAGHFVVEPRLNVLGHTPRSTTAPVVKSFTLEGVVLQSVIPKWLGPVSQWTKHMANAALLGYNMIHYAPVQARGQSDSPYSLYDQLSLADDLFPVTGLSRKVSQDDRWKLLGQALRTIESTYGILALTDVVLNHTADNTPWLQQHPESGYNLENSPHLVPAYEVDEALLKFSGQLPEHGLPADLACEADLHAVMNVLRTDILPALKLWEYRVVDVDTAEEQCRRFMASSAASLSPASLPTDFAQLPLPERAALFAKLAVRDEHPGRRFGKSVDMPVAVAFVMALQSVALEQTGGWPEETIERSCQTLKELLDAANLPLYREYDDDMETIVRNVSNTAKYERLAEDGPRRGTITADSPLMTSYFTRLPDSSATRKHSKEARVLANNGWIWGGNPLHDFAGPGSAAYLRRDVIVWGDCVKLRYGDRPSDNPWLWSHMTKYAELMAQHFHGFRLDNCHSTPLALAEHILDAARRVRPDLYLTAELFTGSEDIDIAYVSRLGIHSLVRESMRADDVRELSRLVHRYGGIPIGSFDESCRKVRGAFRSTDGEHTAAPCWYIPVQPRAPHAIFMDCTHDNETPHQRRMAEDTLPNAAVVSMSCCAMGSVRGYDEIFPKLLDLVSERRMYPVLKDPLQTGIGALKHKLQILHSRMAARGCNEIFVHQEGQYILVHRQNPDSRQGYLLIAHSYFAGAQQHCDMAPTVLRGTTAKYMFGGRLEILDRHDPSGSRELSGLPSQIVSVPQPTIEVATDEQGSYTTIRIPKDFAPGSILMFETQVDGVDGIGGDLEAFLISAADRPMAELSPLELNIVLYRCGKEEEDTTPGNGAYRVPGHGELSYCGLEGFMSVLRDIIHNNDLGHPVCDHLRNGRWAIAYIRDRIARHLTLYPALKPLHQWYEERVARLEKVPNFLIPKLFALVVHASYQAAVRSVAEILSPFARESSELTNALARCSVQMLGQVSSTGLSPKESSICLAAGLPHFATHHVRCWGRDTFIAMHGLFLVTGQLEAARNHILAFAGNVRHGLIPNLLDSARKPRYNARDATWWLIQAVQDYCKMAPEGTALLDTVVPLRFPQDDRYVTPDDEEAYREAATLGEIIHDICQRHARGIHFREWNAGPELDHAMQDAGFQVDIELDLSTGLLRGGNRWNCGTWMDKMGDSRKAGNFGVPSTPRDGAPIELVGLLKSAVTWLSTLHSQGEFAFEGVVVDMDGKNVQLTYKSWADLLQASFERHFYIPTDPTDDAKHSVDATLINRRGIYKDTVGACQPFGDYQFRPNFAVAMVIAPELFEPKHAIQTLRLAQEHLLGPLGMRTLDPLDWAYRGNYNNANDTDDATVAHGANYHQGPEWLWCTGYFLRALDLFDRKTSADGHRTPETRLVIDKTLRNLRTTLSLNAYAGLPELTNANGAHCSDSCETQAWSAATILSLLHQLATSS